MALKHRITINVSDPDRKKLHPQRGAAAPACEDREVPLRRVHPGVSSDSGADPGAGLGPEPQDTEAEVLDGE